MLAFKLVLPNSAFLNLQALNSSTSKLPNPNAQHTSNGVTTTEVWERWVDRMREIDGLVGGKAVGRLEA